jgi:uncharacterized iron-regulated membrane protein
MPVINDRGPELVNARRLHRLTMTLGVLLFSYWVISGLLIALVDVTDRHQSWAGLGGGPGARLNDLAATAGSVPAPATLAPGISAALAAARALQIASVDYRMTGAFPRLELSEANGDRTTELRFYADSGKAMSPRIADGDPFAPRPGYVERRDRIKSFHKGDAWGLTGQFLGLFTGLLLITLTVSGAYLYLRLWQARRRAGHAAFFWQGREGLWRVLHRSIAIVAAVLVLNKAVTGTVLAWGEIQVQLAIHKLLPFPYPMPTPLPPFSDGPLAGDIQRALQTSFDAAQAAAPGTAIVAIELVNRAGQSRSLVTLGGSQPHTLAYDMNSGAPVGDWATRGVQAGNGYFADWHQVVKRMHRGDIIGSFSGRYLDIATGFALLYLVVSGSVLYGQMLARRRRAGQTGLFWP